MRFEAFRKKKKRGYIPWAGDADKKRTNFDIPVFLFGKQSINFSLKNSVSNLLYKPKGLQHMVNYSQLVFP